MLFSPGELEASESLLMDIEKRSEKLEDKARILRLRSKNQFASKDFSTALRSILSALSALGVDIDPSLNQTEVDKFFEEVQDEILAIGFDKILDIPRASDPKIDLIVQILNDAGEGFSSNHNIVVLTG